MNKSYIIAIIVLVLAGAGLYVISDRRAATADSQANIKDSFDLNSLSTTNDTNSMNTDTSSSTATNSNTQVAQNGDLVSVQYTGKLTDGTVFDSSIPRGQPISFPLGAGAVIPGWEKGILGMKVGEKKVLTIPPADAYGAAGIKNPQTGEVIIPGNATLIFDVELVKIER